MDASERLTWLRRVLSVKVVATFLVWALPALLLPLDLLPHFGMVVPEDPTTLRLFGAVATAMGFAYYYAYRNPLGNLGILKTGIIDNGLITVTIIVLGLTSGVSSWFIRISAVLTAFFCIAFIVLLPREQSTE